jgi:hypothetical protein
MEPPVDLDRHHDEHPDPEDYRAVQVRDPRPVIAVTPTAAGPDRHR